MRAKERKVVANKTVFYCYGHMFLEMRVYSEWLFSLYSKSFKIGGAAYLRDHLEIFVLLLVSSFPSSDLMPGY